MSQTARILNDLKAGRSVTALLALDRYGSMRLSARIHDLKAKGHRIVARLICRGGKRFSEYRLL